MLWVTKNIAGYDDIYYHCLLPYISFCEGKIVSCNKYFLKIYPGYPL